MYLIHPPIVIRNAGADDAAQLAAWWNDGSVMAHAGFPLGLNTSAEKIRESLKTDSDDTRRRLILELDGVPIGEMNYRNSGNGVAEIGIKICEARHQEKGLGRVALSLLIEALFAGGYAEIRLDTNLNNRRAQHVYELLGFEKTGVRADCWADQLGRLQTAVDYALVPARFVNFAHPESSAERR